MMRWASRMRGHDEGGTTKSMRMMRRHDEEAREGTNGTNMRTRKHEQERRRTMRCRCGAHGGTKV
eukprot:3276445-Pyramimonas_sp.AAC.1